MQQAQEGEDLLLTKVIIIMRSNSIEEDEDQRGIFNRVFINEKDNIMESFNKRFVDSAMRVQTVTYVGNSVADACLRRIALIGISGVDGDVDVNKLPTSSAELHAAFGLDEFLAPQLEFAIACADDGMFKRQ